MHISKKNIKKSSLFTTMVILSLSLNGNLVSAGSKQPPPPSNAYPGGAMMPGGAGMMRGAAGGMMPGGAGMMPSAAGGMMTPGAGGMMMRPGMGGMGGMPMGGMFQDKGHSTDNAPDPTTDSSTNSRDSLRRRKVKRSININRQRI